MTSTVEREEEVLMDSRPIRMSKDDSIVLFRSIADIAVSLGR